MLWACFVIFLCYIFKEQLINRRTLSKKYHQIQHKTQMVKQTDPYRITNTNSTEWNNDRMSQRALTQQFSLRKAQLILDNPHKRNTLYALAMDNTELNQLTNYPQAFFPFSSIKTIFLQNLVTSLSFSGNRLLPNRTSLPILCPSCP